MLHLPLNALRAFAMVYDTGGIRPAARTLGVAHSSVSRHVRELEAWLGSDLLIHRDGKRSLAFSPQGEALGKAALSSLSELAGAVAAISEVRPGNSVTIDTTPSFAVRWLLPRLGTFEQAHKWIQLSVLVDQRRKTPAEAGADICIRMGRGPWPGETCIPFMDDALYPVMSPDAWRSNGKPGKIADLARLKLIHDRDPQTAWSHWKKQHGPADLDVRAGSRFTSSDLVLRAAEQGMGVALARDRLARDSVNARTLIAPFGDLAVDLPKAHWIVTPQVKPVSSAIQAVVDWLVREGAPCVEKP